MHHILVVDDNPVDRELVRGLLEKQRQFHVEFASNGIEAIEHLEAATPLAVVTDLHMPEGNGLALVKEVRRRFPTIPVVLMTAFGSEEIAVEALVEGAADYVPKHRLASELLRAVESVTSFASTDGRHEQLSRFVSYKKLRYGLPSDANLIPPLADQLQQTAASLGLIAPADRLRLAKCLVEALRNAVLHGGGGATEARRRDDTTRSIQVEAEFTLEAAIFAVRDPGPGFDAKAVVDPRLNPVLLTGDKGRGLALIQLFMDEVRFNDLGNEIIMLKRRPLPSVER